MYTDGVTDAMDKHEEFFSQCRLETTLHGGSAQSSKAVVEEVVSEVGRFAQAHRKRRYNAASAWLYGTERS